MNRIDLIIVIFGLLIAISQITTCIEKCCKEKYNNYIESEEE